MNFKRICYFFVFVLFFSCSNSGESTNLSTNKIVGNWQLFSQKVNGNETVTNCTKQTVFVFEANRVLRRTFYTSTNNNCSASAQIIGNWFYLGGTSYQIENASGDSSEIDVTFSGNDNEFTTSETDNNIVTVSVFQRN